MAFSGAFVRPFRPAFDAGAAAGVDPSFRLTCTTTGAQTLTIYSLGVAAGKTVRVTWGDGSYNDYTAGEASRTHAYAGAGTWTVSMSLRADIYKLDLRDAKISGVIDAANPMPSGLTYLRLSSLPNLTWTVSATTPMPSGLTYLNLTVLANLTWTVSATVPMPTGLTYLILYNLANLTWTVSATVPMPTGLTSLSLYNLANLTWTVSATVPMPTGLTSLSLDSLSNLTWTVSATVPMPTGLTYLYFYKLPNLTWTVSATTPMPTGVTDMTLITLAGVTVEAAQWARINGIVSIRYENSLSAAAVDAVLQGVWANKANYTYATPSLDLLGGGNAIPNGTYADPSPSDPSTGMEYKYCLVNDIPSAGPAWTVQTA